MSKSQPVYDIIDKIDMPSGEEIFFPMGKNLPNAFKDHNDTGFVAGLDHPQSVLLGQEISREAGQRYTLLPLQVSYDRTHSDKQFRKIMRDYWIWDREVILKDGNILPDPVVKEIEGELVYEGKKIPVKIDESDVFATLISAGILEEPEYDVNRGHVYFEDGKSSVWSYWYPGDGCFYVNAYRPSGSAGNGIAAFLKNDEKEYAQKPKVRYLDEDEYQKLVAKAEKYDRLVADLGKGKDLSAAVICCV